MSACSPDLRENDPRCRHAPKIYVRAIHARSDGRRRRDDVLRCTAVQEIALDFNAQVVASNRWQPTNGMGAVDRRHAHGITALHANLDSRVTPLPNIVMAYVVMAYLDMAYINMAFIVVADSYI